MAGLRIHTQHLILSGTGVRPTVPNPTNITPDDSRWREDTDILKGELAYNETDDIWYTRTANNTIKPLSYQQASYNIRADSSVISTGNEQFVEFSSSLETINYSLKIQSVPDLGIEYINKAQNGFTIKFVDEGLFDYVAVKNI